MRRQEGVFDLDGIKNSLKTLDEKLQDENIWNNQEVASKLLKEQKDLKATLEKFENWSSIFEDAQLSLELDDLGLIEESFENIKSLAFFHIPLKEYDDAWNAYTENNNTNSENIKYHYGIKDENVCCGAGSDDLFETMQSLGSTQGIFCGHDHINNYSVEYKGIRLTYGMSVDYLAYKDIDKQGDYRGCTLITVNPDGSFDCESQNYYQDKYQPKFEKEQVTFVR